MVPQAALFESQVTFCYSADLDRTADFYENILGLRRVLDQGTCRIYQTAPTAFVGFCSHLHARRPEGIILTLVTRDVDGRYQELRARGLEFEHPPGLNERFQIYHCFFRDPDGYLLEIQRFDDPRWAESTPEP